MVVLPTTTLTFEKATEDEPGDGRTWETIADQVPAQVGSPAGSEEVRPGGGRQTITTDFSCDALDELLEDLDHTCRATDDVTGEVWEVSWVKVRVGVGLDHMHGQLTRFDGGGR